MANVEIHFLDESCDDLNKLDELLNIDSSLVRSFLEDSQVEEGDDDDDEVLRAMIESLEPEITSQDSCSETSCSDDGSSEAECCSSDHQLLLHPHRDQDFEWIGHDMEMDYSCPGYEITGYFIDGYMVEVGGMEDYSQVCYGEAMEEDDYIGLWQ